MVRETVRRVGNSLRGLQTAAYVRLVAPVEGLHQAAYVLAGLTLASQLLALLRDRTFAHMFGAGQTLDLYYAAFRVPDLVFAIVSSLVSAYVIIPRLATLREEESRDLLSHAASFLVVAGGAVCLVLAFFMPAFLSLLYPDLMTSSMREEFVFLGRLLLVQPILLGLASLFSSVTQVHRRFFLFALAPVLYNLGIIGGTLYLYPAWGLSGIGAGVVVGAVAYVLVNLPVLLEQGMIPRIVWPRWSLVLPIMRDSVPRSLALGMGSITALVLTAIASRIGTGAVSVFTFAGNLQAVPLALIGSSYAVAAFPALSKSAAEEHRQEFTSILSSSARHIILWSLVALGLIVVLRAHVVRAVLGSGAFDWDATRLTAALFALLAIGLAAESLKLLFSRALYAARQSWRPLLYQIAAGAVTVVLALELSTLSGQTLLEPIARALKVDDVAGITVLYLALASVAGQIVLVGLSLVALRSVAPGLSRSLLRPSRDGLLAGVAAGVTAHYALVVIGELAPLTTLVAVLWQGAFGTAVGLAAAALVLALLRNAEFALVVDVGARLLRRRPAPAEVLEPSGEEPAQV